MSWDDGLKPMQRKFVEVYVTTHNSNQAAREAGYKHPSVQGSQNLKKLSIRDAIRKLQAECEFSVSHNRILHEYALMAFYDPGELYDGEGNLANLKNLDLESRKVLSGLDVETSYTEAGDAITKIVVKKIKHSDRLRALDSLSRATGLFKDKVAVEVTGMDSLLKRIANSGKSRPQDNVVVDED